MCKANTSSAAAAIRPRGAFGAALAALLTLCAIGAGAQETIYMSNGAVYKGQITGASQGDVQLFVPLDKLSLTIGNEGIRFIEFPGGAGQLEKLMAPMPPSVSTPTAPIEIRNDQARIMFGRSHFFGAVEWFDPGDAYNTFEVNLPVSGVVVNQFSDQAISVSSGYGFRLGMMWPIKITAPVEITRAGMGFSLGFVHGPAADITIDLANLNLGTGLGQVNANTSFKRLMVEFVKDVPLSSRGATLRLGGAVGLAIGELDTNIDAPGLASTAISTTNQPVQGTTIQSWTGLSWELSPAITFYKGNTEFWVGFRYSVFPKLSGSTNTVAFEWNTTGFYLGFGF